MPQAGGVAWGQRRPPTPGRAPHLARVVGGPLDATQASALLCKGAALSPQGRAVDGGSAARRGLIHCTTREVPGCDISEGVFMIETQL